MPLTGVLAVVDLAVGVWLLWTVPKQSRANKEAVVIVAAVLLGVGGWLAVLALD